MMISTFNSIAIYSHWIIIIIIIISSFKYSTPLTGSVLNLLHHILLLTHRSPQFDWSQTPCNHYVKYLDELWEDLLFAEEPGYIVVRRETDPMGAAAAAAADSMDFIPPRGRKELADEPDDSRLNDKRAIVGGGRGQQQQQQQRLLQPHRDSRSATAAAMLPPNNRVRKGTTLLDDIFSNEDFFPTRGKKLSMLNRINTLLQSRPPPPHRSPLNLISDDYNSQPSASAKADWWWQSSQFPGPSYDEDYDVTTDSDQRSDLIVPLKRRGIANNNLSKQQIFTSSSAAGAASPQPLVLFPAAMWRRKRYAQKSIRDGHYDTVTTQQQPFNTSKTTQTHSPKSGGGQAVAVPPRPAPPAPATPITLNKVNYGHY